MDKNGTFAKIHNLILANTTLQGWRIPNDLVRGASFSTQKLVGISKTQNMFSVYLSLHSVIYTFRSLQNYKYKLFKMKHANVLFIQNQFWKVQNVLYAPWTWNKKYWHWHEIANAIKEFFTISCTPSRSTIITCGNWNCISQWIYLIWSLLAKTLLDVCILIPDVQYSIVFLSPIKIDGCHNHLFICLKYFKYIESP